MTSPLVADAIGEGLEWLGAMIGRAEETNKLALFRRLAAEEPPGWVRRGLVEKPDIVDRLVEIGLGAGLDRSNVELAVAEAFVPVRAPTIANLEAPTPRRDTPVAATPYQWVDPEAIPRRQWLYGRHLIRKFLSVDIAPGGVGKSALITVEALSLAVGRDLLAGGKPIAPAKVWLWNGEDPLDELQRRIQAACHHYGLCRSDIEGRLFVDTGRETPIVIAREERRGGIVIAVPVVEAIKATIRENGIDVFLGDPFVASHGVPENDNGAINAVARQWAMIADDTACAIGLVHHVRKPNGGDLTAEDARGASALIAAARSTRALNRMTKEDAERAGIADHRLHFRIDSVKANLAPPGDAADWRRLENVELANGDRVGVVVEWAWPNPFEDVSVADLREVQKRISQGAYRADPRASNWAGKVVAEVLNFDLSEPSSRAPVRSILNTWRTTGALKVVSLRDGQRKPKEFIAVGEWA